jgi:hypothetical protein
MIWCARRHHSPLTELSLLRPHTCSGTLAASIRYYTAFGAFVPNSIESFAVFLKGSKGASCGPGEAAITASCAR